MEDESPYSPVPTSAQEITLWIAGALLALACFGFLPGLARYAAGLDLGGLASESLLFGLFHISVLHNMVHLLLGAAAVLSAGSRRICRTFLAVAGALMMLLVLYGQIDSTPVIPDLVPIGKADTWLHSVLALTMILTAGLASTRNRLARSD